jgi:hypothetical protein
MQPVLIIGLLVFAEDARILAAVSRDLKPP